MAKPPNCPPASVELNADAPASERIRARILASGQRFNANDNIAAFIEPGEIDQLQNEVQAQMAGVLRALVIDTDSDHNT